MAEPRRDNTASAAIYISWMSFQRRQVAMAPLVGFDCVFLPLPDTRGGKLRQACSWVDLFIRTTTLLRKSRPTTIWVQLPLVPLLWAALLYRKLFDGKVVVIADCHNGMFAPPWSRFPLGVAWLDRCDRVLVHNAAVMEQALALGVSPDRVRVLEDVPLLPALSPAATAIPPWLAGRPRPWLLFPGSFAADEPIAELLDAARLLPDWTLIVTGNVANAARRGHQLGSLPPNVLTPGFLPVEEFDGLLREADVVLALTRCEGIQLSVCNEALGFSKPLVASDTQVLRALFGEAAVLVKTDAAGIAAGMRAAVADAERLAAASSALAAKRRSAWVASLESALPPRCTLPSLHRQLPSAEKSPSLTAPERPTGP